MTWWLKAAEELKALRQLGIAKPGSVISGFLLDVPTATIEGEANATAPGAPAAVTPPDPIVPTLPVTEPGWVAPSLPAAQNAASAKAPQSSFLSGTEKYKLHWEIRPQQIRKTASK